MERKELESTDLWHYERTELAKGSRLTAGVDEAGRGPLAGPVVAAAVVLPFNCDAEGIYDSKQISSRKRESAFDKIYDLALSIGIGIVEADEIDRINILQATYRAMRMAVDNLSVRPDIFLVDGYPIRDFPHSQIGIVDGDAKSVSIAAASIVAKVTRDRIMREYDHKFPEYGFARHNGYPTREHIEKLAAHGVCDIHRKSFGPVAKELNPLWERAKPPWAPVAKNELFDI